LYWLLVEMGIHCDVIAPTLVPMKVGDKVKTDRRDAEKLARCYRSGDLTSIWVPDRDHEALRDLVRAREAAKQDERRARQRLQKLLLRRGRRKPEGMTAWTQKHLQWLREVRFDEAALEATRQDYLAEVEHQGERLRRLEASIDTAIELAPAKLRALIEALQALRGVAKISAVTIAAEIGTMRRFEKPTQLMGYSGAVPREHSSGGKIRRSAITKTGNAHLRWIVVEAAWSYRHFPSRRGALAKRQENLPEDIRAIAWEAQHRLHQRYLRLTGRGKNKGQVITALARELFGFIWAIGTAAERIAAEKAAA
jgi:transposase